MSPTRRDFLITTTAALSASRIIGANERVQVGFIGYGLIGAQHVHDFKNLPDVLAAMSEVYEPRLRRGPGSLWFPRQGQCRLSPPPR